MKVIGDNFALFAVSNRVTTRRALVLCRTEILGVHLVEGLISASRDVTIFNRGQTNPSVLPSVPRLTGDRTSDASAFHPDDVDRVADVLDGQHGQYVFISTVSAYKDFRIGGIEEDYPLAAI